MLIGTWLDAQATNRWLQFTPDGNVISQDEQKKLFLGSYRMMGYSNVVMLSDNTSTNTSTVRFYFRSPDEVIMEFPDETILFKRGKSD